MLSPWSLAQSKNEQIVRTRGSSWEFPLPIFAGVCPTESPVYWCEPLGPKPHFKRTCALGGKGDHSAQTPATGSTLGFGHWPASAQPGRTHPVAGTHLRSDE